MFAVTPILLICLLPSSLGFSTARPELGEWVVRHSTHRRAPPDNRAVVHVYPENRLVLAHRHSLGPLVCLRQLHGMYTLTTNSDSVTDEKRVVTCTFHEKRDTILSVYGVGLHGVFEVTTKKEAFKQYKFFFMMHGVSDVFLTATDPVDESTFYCHLVRCVRIDEPNIDVPFSTFIFTQLLGIVFSALIQLLISPRG